VLGNRGRLISRFELVSGATSRSEKTNGSIGTIEDEANESDDSEVMQSAESVARQVHVSRVA
jgi:hypothetical protein